ncbi:MAG: GIY-YIG nuclease family protein [Gracilibacteraceae bacterium]|nr:GIY-YIG nuclease family protein [Gracilibacteraceae bacterium]
MEAAVGVVTTVMIIAFAAWLNHKSKQEKRKRFVEENSITIQKIIALNDSYINLVPTTSIELDSVICKSKGNFDKFGDKDILAVLYRKMRIVKGIVSICRGYSKCYKDIKMEMSSYEDNVIEDRDYFLAYEREFVQKNNLIRLSIGELFYITVSYTSPQGRSNYRHKWAIPEQMIQEELAKEEKMTEDEKETHMKSVNKLYGNKIYFFTDIHQPGMCIGQTTQKDVEDRIKQEYKNMPKKPWMLLFYVKALTASGKWFTDKQFHAYLKKRGYKNFTDHAGSTSEWFEITMEQAKTEIEKFIASS